MTIENNKQTVEPMGTALWSAHLEQMCLTGHKPFFVMDQTARTGP
jgi:hypothetical protein